MLRVCSPNFANQVNGDVASMGITDFAQNQLGDIVYVDLPKVGASFKQGCVRAV